VLFVNYSLKPPLTVIIPGGYNPGVQMDGLYLFSFYFVLNYTDRKKSIILTKLFMKKRKYYRTSEIARTVGVHPNTVRLYEAIGLLQPVPRARNGYRRYSPAHLEQMRLITIALRAGFVESSIRKKAVSIIKTSAGGNAEGALEEAHLYLSHIQDERMKADEALQILRNWINKKDSPDNAQIFTGRRHAAGLVGITTDALRNWERNGLLDVPCNSRNGYRIYGQKEIERAKVIRTLRAANFTIMAILKMLKAIDDKIAESEIIDIVSTLKPDEDMTYATDRWIHTLAETEKNAEELIQQLMYIIAINKPTPSPQRY
jgi:DNA-binding transcriptional MerR regulator